MNRLLLICVFLGCTALHAQYTDSAHVPGEAAPTNPTPVLLHKNRVFLVTAGSVAAYTGSIAALSSTWYKNYAQTNFHFFNDNGDWLQVDKAGHFFSAYNAARLNTELWKWAGLSKSHRTWMGGLSGTAFLTAVEVLDGFSSGWGFSMGDLAADLAGSGSYIAQELLWNEQRIHIKFSFHRVSYADASMRARADALFGSSTAERILKDYNGQTYWASVNLKSFFRKSNLPAWFNVALGYGASGMLGGTENILRDKNGTVVFNRTEVPRLRHWYLAPDIDLTRIKTKSRFLKTTFFLLNAFKFPAPSIGVSKNGLEWNWIHF